MMFSLCSIGLHRWSVWSKVPDQETYMATLMEKNCMCCGIFKYRMIQKK